jgi:hypothetical protein
MENADFFIEKVTRAAFSGFPHISCSACFEGCSGIPRLEESMLTSMRRAIFSVHFSEKTIRAMRYLIARIYLIWLFLAGYLPFWNIGIDRGLVQWAAQVVIGIQLCCQSEHRTAVAARQRGVDIGNDFCRRARVIYIRVGGVEQRRHRSSEQDARAACRSRAAGKAQRLA